MEDTNKNENNNNTQTLRHPYVFVNYLGKIFSVVTL